MRIFLKGFGKFYGKKIIIASRNVRDERKKGRKNDLSSNVFRSRTPHDGSITIDDNGNSGEKRSRDK